MATRKPLPAFLLRALQDDRPRRLGKRGVSRRRAIRRAGRVARRRSRVGLAASPARLLNGVSHARGEPARVGLMVPQSASSSGYPARGGQSTHDRPRTSHPPRTTAAQNRLPRAGLPSRRRSAVPARERSPWSSGPCTAPRLLGSAADVRPAPLAAPAVMGGSCGRFLHPVMASCRE